MNETDYLQMFIGDLYDVVTDEISHGMRVACRRDARELARMAFLLHPTLRERTR